jgi:membrane protein DedA with SNARE-associated domain/rhodanese-related sulfurtransferase
VLAERVGLPLPAAPTLAFAGALAALGKLSAPAIFVAAFVACVLGDTLWYAAGVRYGRKVVGLLCRISLSRDSCVRVTENRFAQWGRFTLVIAKFIPGLSMVVRPLAGMLKIGWWQFEVFNGLGTVLWVSASIGIGMIFHEQVEQLLRWLRDFGLTAFSLFVAVFVGFVAVKWWQRRRFAETLRIARVTAHDLHLLMDGGTPPIVIDVRSAIAREADSRRIAGARVIALDGLMQRLDGIPADREIVFYCDCPNEASAAFAARRLLKLGYVRVRPLLGGLTAWVAAGYPVDTDPTELGRAISLRPHSDTPTLP